MIIIQYIIVQIIGVKQQEYQFTKIKTPPVSNRKSENSCQPMEKKKLIAMEDVKKLMQDTSTVNFGKNLEEIRQRADIFSISVPPHRLTPLKSNWETIVKTIVEHLKLQIKMNLKKKCVEIRASPQTLDSGAPQKAADFLKAFMLGFELQDALALLRLDDLYIESFEIKDVKNLEGDHLSRCIGRICGEKGKTKYAIENSTRTRIIIAESKIHILGTYSNNKFARDAICNLILGSPPGKVYSQLKTISKRYRDKM